jgi:hypothetical protein
MKCEEPSNPSLQRPLTSVASLPRLLAAEWQVVSQPRVNRDAIESWRKRGGMIRVVG